MSQPLDSHDETDISRPPNMAGIDFLCNYPARLDEGINAAGDRHPPERIVQDYLRRLVWHPQTDGYLAGRIVGECFGDKPR